MGLAMISIVVSVVASLMVNSFNVMNKANSTTTMESSHFAALYFLKNPKNFIDPTATNISSSGILPAGAARDCLLGKESSCSSFAIGGWQHVSALGGSVTVTRQVPNCTVSTGGVVSCSPTAGYTTISVTQNGLNGYLDKNGAPCSWGGTGTTNCWYERKAEYQLKDCNNNESCEWLDVRLVTRPLTDSSVSPYNPNMANEVYLKTRETNFGFNKYALLGGNSIDFSCASTGFATQIDYRRQKALCQGIDPSKVSGSDCTSSGGGNQKMNAFGSPSTCQNMPNSNCTRGYGTLTLGGNSGGVACR